jgi:NADPH-dependent 2,4-dienoyl-CoA reductase/sulfur reductase-like enzyme
MEAARVAALRGHEVTLYERKSKLGGQLELAVIPPNKVNLQLLVPYLSNQLRKAGVKVGLGREVTGDMIEEMKPDVVVLATGIVPLIPDIPGIGGEGVVNAEDVLLVKVQVGDKMVVIGGDLVGCETAEFLAVRGKRVTIVDVLPQMATKVIPRIREPLLKRLADAGVEMLVSLKCTQVTEEGIEIEDEEGRQQTIEANTIIVAAGSRPNQELLERLKGKVPQIHLAGDCVEPRDIMAAMADGARVGRAL